MLQYCQPATLHWRWYVMQACDSSQSVFEIQEPVYCFLNPKIKSYLFICLLHEEKLVIKSFHWIFISSVAEEDTKVHIFNLWWKCYTFFLKNPGPFDFRLSVYHSKKSLYSTLGYKIGYSGILSYTINYKFRY